MPAVHETAYPRLKSTMTDQELQEVYTPTPEELAFAEHPTRTVTAKVGLLVLLKTFQRLGYFLPLAQVPRRIIAHITACAGMAEIPADLATYDTAIATRYRHMAFIRERLRVTAYGPAARRAMITAAVAAARTKEDLADIINVALEELVRHRYELPAFSTLERAAFTARHTVNRRYHHLIGERLAAPTRARLEEMLTRPQGARRSSWDTVKQEPKSPTLKHMKEVIAHLRWLQTQDIPAAAFAEIPAVKLQQFAAEARALDVADMNKLRWSKRYALAATLIRRQVAKTLDELTEMFLRRMHKLHQRGEEALEEYRRQHQDRTDALIALLREVALVMLKDGTAGERVAAIAGLFGPDPAVILERCEEHTAHAGNNYYPFLPTFYRSQRAVFFHFLESVTLRSTSQDRSVEDAIAVLLSHRTTTSPWLEDVGKLNLSWVPDKWWRLVTGQRQRSARVSPADKRYFELCLFSQIWLELKSGDLYVDGSDTFSDYRAQLISWDEYEQGVKEYGEQVSIPVDGKAFVHTLREWLESLAAATDASFPNNESVRIEDGEIVLTKLERQPLPEGLRTLERLLQERLPVINIVDVLSETDQWLHWTRHFGPLSGFEPKFSNPRERYITTTFCYGCNLGPTQTARSIPGLDRKQVARVNQRHVSEALLDNTVVSIINAYNRFTLPQIWGSGQHVSADGTKWDVYEQNLLAEYHVRYGGWGGIGYYHVSDTYIALFSRFIPCGVWEGTYILDGLVKNASDIQPDIVHSDTHGQSAPIFGLAHLLGIKLMPRIRNWKGPKLFRPSKHARYEHIDGLFSEPINWRLIETLLPDLLRVGMSIKAGRLIPSTILRRLGTYSRKNRLYFAMRELGWVIRTGFLLQYLSDPKLRRLILRAMNKNESFNGFLKWLFFGGEGIIAENRRDEQRKIVKYNHLVANLVIFHNVVTMTKVIRQLVAEGYRISADALTALSPYQTRHLNRFGHYTLNLDHKPEPIEYDLPLSVLQGATTGTLLRM
jgi:TnpA family transposase